MAADGSITRKAGFGIRKPHVQRPVGRKTRTPGPKPQDRRELLSVQEGLRLRTRDEATGNVPMKPACSH